MLTISEEAVLTFIKKKNHCLFIATNSSLLSEHKTTDWVRGKISFFVQVVGLQETLLTTVKRWKLAWFGHVTRHDSLSKTIFLDILEGRRLPDRQNN